VTVVAVSQFAAETSQAAQLRAPYDEPKIYAVRGSANYCPSGLQPITLNGVICCGTPNQSVSYQQAKAHPVTRTKRVRSRVRKASSRIVCPVGEKGCYSQ